MFFLFDAIKLAVNIINANLAKSEVVKIFCPFIIKNLLVTPLLKKYADNKIIQDRYKICLEYFFRILNLTLYITIIAIKPIINLIICLDK